MQVRYVYECTMCNKLLFEELEEQIEELDKEWEECKEGGVQSEISKS